MVCLINSANGAEHLNLTRYPDHQQGPKEHPYVGFFGPLQIGQSIDMRGRVHEVAKGFVIEFREQPLTKYGTIHLQLRGYFDTNCWLWGVWCDNGVVVLNSYRYGEWANEEKISLPKEVTPGKPFSSRFTVEPNGTRVKMGSGTVFTWEWQHYIKDFVNINCVTVKGEVALDEVHYTTAFFNRTLISSHLL